MLRLAVIVLVVANLLFFAFARGSFDGLFGLASQGDREPGRLARQVRPETIRILPASAPASGTGASATATACLEAGPVADADTDAAQTALAAVLPAGSWTDTRTETGGAGVRLGGRVYRVPAADPATVTRLLALTLAPGGRYPFTACAPAGR